MMQLQTLLLTICLLFITQLAYAQPSNDNCLQAITLTNVSDYCSEAGEFNNIAATPSSSDPFCFPDTGNDVWFKFTAIGTQANIVTFGPIENGNGGTLLSPQFAVYSGDCSVLTEIACASDNMPDANNLAETFAGPLIPGATYYIQVSARDNNTGTFQLCVNNFNEVPTPSGDCNTGAILCDKSSFHRRVINWCWIKLK